MQLEQFPGQPAHGHAKWGRDRHPGANSLQETALNNAKQPHYLSPN